MQASQKYQTLTLLGRILFGVALLVAIVLVATPAVGTFLLSFQDYRLDQGFFSPFVGLRNYEILLQADGYGLSLVRTLQFSALSVVTLFAAGTLAGYLLRAIPTRWLRHTIGTLLLVPPLMPGQLWAHAFLAIFPTQAVQSLALPALWCGMKYVGLAALLTTAAMAQGNRSATTPVLSAAAAALGLFALLGLPDYLFLRALPPTSAMRSSLDLFVYRQGFTQANHFSVASAVTMSAIPLRTAMLAAVAWPVAALVRRLLTANAETQQATSSDRLLSLSAAVVIVLAAAAALAMASHGAPLAALRNTLLIYPVYVILSCAGAAVNTALCFCLARPVVTARQPALRRGTTAILLALTALGAAPIFVGGYFQFRALGMMDTVFPVLFSGMGSLLGVWPLVFAARALGVTDDKQWLLRMWRPSLALLAVGAALRMNDTLPNMIYITQANLMHPLQALTTVQAAEEFLGHSVPLGAISALIALVTMAVPVALLLLVRTVFTEQETVSMVLPGK